jgi:hypothetical protein
LKEGKAEGEKRRGRVLEGVGVDGSDKVFHSLFSFLFSVYDVNPEST